MEKLQSLFGEQAISAQCGFIAGLVGVYLLLRSLKTPKHKMPPGPRSWPPFGHLSSLKTMELLHKNFRKWRNRYGDVVTIKLGPQSCVILMTSDVIRQAYVTNGHDYSGRYQLGSVNILTDNGKGILLAQPTSIWRLQRHIAYSALRKYASGATLENNIESAFESFVYGVKKQDGVINLPVEIMKMVFNLLSTMCFGKRFTNDDPWLVKYIDKYARVVELAGMGFISDFIPALKFLDRKKLKGFRDTTDAFNAMLKDEFEDHRQHFDANCPRDLIDEILLQLQKQQDHPEANPVLAQMTESHFSHILNDLFFGGTDTSRITLSIMIGLVVEHPEVQKKLHQELDDVLGDSGQVTLNLKEQLVYTNAVLHESMRLRTVVPVGFPHLTTRDTSLDGYTIPKDTIVFSYVHGVHTDPENFENPHEFHPHRWIDADGRFQHFPHKFIPFSFGPRGCMGESLARTELLLFTAMLFHKYEFRPADESKPFKTPFKDIPMAIDTKSFQLKLIDRHPA